jgi:hypothetical protein
MLLMNLAHTRPTLQPKARIDPKNEIKKIKASDRFADFLQLLPACAAKLRTGHDL